MKNYKTFEEAKEFATVTCDGKTYAMLDTADYCTEGDLDTSIYSAPGIDEENRTCTIYWKFDNEDIDNIVNDLSELDWEEAYEVEYTDD